MSNKVKQIIDKLQQSNNLIQQQRKEIDKLKSMAINNIVNKYNTESEEQMKAYPYNPQFNQEHNGMDLRDYIATNAMQGMLSNPEFLQVVTKEEVNGSDCASRVAKVSYKYADAMMKAREQ
jgi:hypothetical protein